MTGEHSTGASDQLTFHVSRSTCHASRFTPRPLRILHVDPERAWGGGQAQLVSLAHYLAGRGHEQLVACDPEGVLWRVLDAHGIGRAPVRIHNQVDLLAAWRLRRLLAARPYDIVHFHTARAHALAPWLPRRRSRLIVSRLMDYAPHMRPRVQYLYNHCVDGVIAISQAIANVLIEAGVDQKRVRVIYLGIDPEPFEAAIAARGHLRQTWGAEVNDVVLFTAAVLEPRKGHNVLLHAMARLVREGLPLRWVVCGEGSLRMQLENLARELQVLGRVTFLGFSREVPRLLAGADVFVLPSLHEGLGIAAMEAMAAGLPVIASRVGGLAEVVADGETGLLVPPGEVDALVAGLRRMAADPSWRGHAGERGRARVRERFTSTAMASAVEAYYYALLEGRSE